MRRRRRRKIIIRRTFLSNVRFPTGIALFRFPGSGRVSFG
jgi:hypothetical protein